MINGMIDWQTFIREVRAYGNLSNKQYVDNFVSKIVDALYEAIRGYDVEVRVTLDSMTELHEAYSMITDFILRFNVEWIVDCKKSNGNTIELINGSAIILVGPDETGALGEGSL